MRAGILFVLPALWLSVTSAQERLECGDDCSPVDRYAFTAVIHGSDDPNRIDLAEAMIAFLSGTFLQDQLHDGMTPPDVRVSRYFDVDIGEAATFLTVLDQEVGRYRSEASAIKAELCAQGFPNGQAYAEAAKAFDNRAKAARLAAYSRLKGRIPPRVLTEMEAIEEHVRRGSTIVVIDFDEVIKHYDFRDLVANDCGGGN